MTDAHYCNNLNLRKAKISDWHAIENLRRRASETSITHYPKKDLKIMHDAGEHFLLDFLNPFRKIYVATLENKVVGYMEISLQKKWFWHLFVDPDYMGKGIGKYLMNEAEKAFKKKNIQTIGLYARLNAVEFYKRRGFIDQGRYIWRNIFTRYHKIEMRVMSKKL